MSRPRTTPDVRGAASLFSPEGRTGEATAHKHEWTALVAHYGPYVGIGSKRDQDCHYHACECGAQLVGKGRWCDQVGPHEVRYG